MYQLYGINPSKLIVPIGAFTNTNQKGAPVMTREALTVNDVYKNLAVSNPLPLGAQTYEFSILPAGFVYELYSIGFYYTGGTITTARISIKIGVQTFMLQATANLPASVGLVWNGYIILAAASSVYLNLNVTVVNPTITGSALGYRKELIE